MRTFTSLVPAPSALLANVPAYWFAPPAVLTKNRGLNRFVWNLRYSNPKILPFGYFGGLLDYVEYTLAEHAVSGQTPRDQPEGSLVAPGEYVATLTVGGKSYRQPLTLKPDPRVRALQADLVPVLIGRLKQESVLRGRPLEGLAITRSTAGKAPGRAIVEFSVTSQGFPEPGNAPAPTPQARP